MNSKDRIRTDTFVRVNEFGATNSADFPAGSIAAQQFAVIAAVIAEVQRLIGEQTEGRNDARFSFHSKATAREDMREEMADINQTSHSMVYQFPGIDLKFRMPKGGNDTNLLAAARAFYESSAEYNDAMIEYGLPTDFRANLSEAITDFEQSLNAPGAATDTHVAATADIGAEIRKGMIALRTLDGVVKNKYRNDPGKLAAWTSASHLERTAVKSTPLVNKK